MLEASVDTFNGTWFRIVNSGNVETWNFQGGIDKLQASRTQAEDSESDRTGSRGGREFGFK